VVTIVPKWWMFKNDQEFLGYSQELQASTIATFELTVSTLRVIGPWSGCHRRESACALRLTSILILIPQKEHGPPLFFLGELWPDLSGWTASWWGYQKITVPPTI
jgi:hypothetical protein